jgi:phosphoglycolate phosphatase-like HAD superfamily hydrolase
MMIAATDFATLGSRISAWQRIRPMAEGPGAIFFDVDGVLIDSLANHLTFCRAEATRLSLNISIPNVDTFRQMVLSGTTISPMAAFFRAVGFPENRIAQAVNDYDANFFATHPSTLFQGVDPTLRALHNAGTKLGFVTSNVMNNVQPVLAPLLALFEPSCRFYFAPGQTKALQIGLGARALGIDVGECVFVGDQPADQTAARDAGSKFVGVTYGWGYRPEAEQSFEVANSPYEIPFAAQRAILQDPEKQFDYAWNWFNYHANQRVEMFNYMFVGLGLFATAIASALDKHLPDFVLASLCILAGIVALIFALIDRRNEHLIGLGEEVLNELERTKIFGRNNWIVSRSGGVVPFGILSRQQHNDHGHGRCAMFIASAWQGRHRIWLRAIAMILGVLFLAGGFLIARYGLPDEGAKAKSLLLEGPG